MKTKTMQQLTAQYKRILKAQYPKLRFRKDGTWNFYEVYPNQKPEDDPFFCKVGTIFSRYQEKACTYLHEVLPKWEMYCAYWYTTPIPYGVFTERNPELLTSKHNQTAETCKEDHANKVNVPK